MFLQSGKSGKGADAAHGEGKMAAALSMNARSSATVVSGSVAALLAVGVVVAAAAGFKYKRAGPEVTEVAPLMGVIV